MKCKWRPNGECIGKDYFDAEKVTKINPSKIMPKKIEVIGIYEDKDSFDMKIEATNIKCINTVIKFTSIKSSNTEEIKIDRRYFNEVPTKIMTLI